MAWFSEELQAIWDKFGVNDAIKEKLLEGETGAFHVWQLAEWVDDVKDWTNICGALDPAITDRNDIAKIRQAYKAACGASEEALKSKSDVSPDDLDKPIDSATRKGLLDAHASYYKFPLQATRQPSDALLGRLHRERERIAFTVINIAKVQSLGSQTTHVKHYAVAEGAQLTIGDFDTGRNVNLSQWLLNLRILYNAYSIIGLNTARNQWGETVLWCSWHKVAQFVDTLTDLATSPIPGSKVRPDLASLQSAELNFRTRVVELLRSTPENGIMFTFNEAFDMAMSEKQSLFHNPVPLQKNSADSSRGKSGNNSAAKGGGKKLQNCTEKQNQPGFFFCFFQKLP